MVNSDGAVYVAARSWHNPSFCDYALVCYDAEGHFAWVQPFNVFPAPKGRLTDLKDMVMDKDDNIILTGVGDYPRMGNHDLDFLTIKYNRHGMMLWAKQYNGSGNGHDKAVKVGVDRQGNVFVVGIGYHGDPANGGTGENITLVKYNADGDKQWAKKWVSEGKIQSSCPNGLAIDTNGNITVAGYVHYTYRDEAARYSVAGYDDFVTLQYDTKGNPRWEKVYNGPDGRNDWVSAVTVDAAGNVVVTGPASNGTRKKTNYDYTTLKYAPKNGAPLWKPQLYNGTGNGDDYPKAITADKFGNVIVTGQSRGEQTSDIVTIKYSP